LIYRVRRAVAVEEDIISLAEWIARKNRAAAFRFLEFVEDSISSLRTMPRRGSIKRFAEEDLGEIRSCAARSFPNHLILYEVRGRIVWIWAVVHGARDYDEILRQRRQ
jgi:plasmid stabilization system protein ParE